MRDAIIAGDEEYVDNFTGGLREQITQFAIQTAKDFGNGYYAKDKENENTVQKNGKKIFYRSSGAACMYPSCDQNVEEDVAGWLYGDYGYGKFDLALNHFNAIKEDKLSHMHFSCHGASTFCWKYVWKNSPYYVNGVECPDFIYDYDPDPEKDGPGALSNEFTSMDYLKEKAKPGDIIWYDNPAKKKSFAHSQLWLGDVTIDGVEIKNAIMNCGSGNSRNDWVIKPFSMSDKKHYYHVSLRDVVVKVEGSDDGYAVQDWIDMDIDDMPLPDEDASED